MPSRSRSLIRACGSKPPDPANAHVSSSLVRQVAALGGDVSPYVPFAVADYLQAAMTA